MGEHVKRNFPVTGMSCAACATSVQSTLSHVEGVDEAAVNFASNSVLVDYDPERISPQQMQKALQAIGYDLIVEEAHPEALQQEQLRQHVRDLGSRTVISAAFSLPVFVLGMFMGHWEPGKWVAMALSFPVLFYFGRGFFVHAFKQARHRMASMDTLVALSTGIAFLFSLFNTIWPSFWTSRGMEPHVYYEAAVVIMTFVTFGKWLEERAKTRTSGAIRQLMGLQPDTAWVLIGNIATACPLDQVRVGDLLRVKPGERIPVDGTVKAGDSFIDESMLSGEPIPLHKKPGDQVFAGTMNGNGSMDIEAAQVGAQTMLARIIQKVQEAQGSKAPVQRLVDRVAAVFVMAVLGIALLTFAIWMFSGVEDAYIHALRNAIAVLVIACPCALGLATPTAIMVGMGRAAEEHILIKDAASLELAHRVDVVVLDKTGTLTAGKPQVVEARWYEQNEGEKAMLQAMEERAEHPLAKAVCQWLNTEAQQTPEAFETLTGQGVKALFAAGWRFVGSKGYLNSQQLQIPADWSDQISTWEQAGHTVIYFFSEQAAIAVFAIADPLIEQAAEAVQDLKDARVEVMLLSGDAEAAVAHVANKAGIHTFKGGMLPADKAERIAELQAQGHVVAMVGDGINDSQALAQADISMAMGHGSDVAMEVATMTLIQPDLRAISKALRLSKLTVRGIRQNLFWAFIYNIIGIPVAAGLLYPFTGFLLDPMIAGMAMAMSSVSVVANSLRLRRVRL